MAKKKIAAKSTELDAKEFFAAISDIEKDKGIPKAYMLEKITQALVAAYKRDHEGITDNVVVDANEELETVRMFVKKDVVEAVDNPHTEISLDDAQRALPRAQLGDVLRIEIKPKNFGRIAAQTARQVIIQGMREAERGMVFDEFSAKEHEILTGSVTRVDERNGSVSIRLTSGSEFTDAFLSAGEQVKGEVIREGDRVRVYVVEVRRSTRGPQVLISRTHPGLVKRLFELEVPEIYDGRAGHVHRPGGGQPHQAGRVERRRERGPHRRLRRPPGPAGERCGGGASGREGGHHQVVRRPRPVRGRRPGPRRRDQRGGAGAGQELPCGGA